MPTRKMGRSKCPPGVFCLTPGLLVFFGVIVALIVGFYYMNRPSQRTNFRYKQQQQQQQQPIIINAGGGDSRYERAPEPSRTWYAPPDIRGAFIPPGAVPINIDTRRAPESYQQMGVINANGQMLPLYGRRNGRGTDIYNYYTRTDTYNPVQIPVNFGRRDCTDDNGCKEIGDGDSVKIHGLGEGTVKLYHIDAPKYIPGVV